MSKFSNFCNFLGSCNSGGIHLVAFYFKLHMFLCNKNYESSEEILHQIKNEFLDEGKGSSADHLAVQSEHSGFSWTVHGALIKVVRHVYQKKLEQNMKDKKNQLQVIHPILPSFPGNFEKTRFCGSLVIFWNVSVITSELKNNET